MLMAGMSDQENFGLSHLLVVWVDTNSACPSGSSPKRVASHCCDRALFRFSHYQTRPRHHPINRKKTLACKGAQCIFTSATRTDRRYPTFPASCQRESLLPTPQETHSRLGPYPGLPIDAPADSNALPTTPQSLGVVMASAWGVIIYSQIQGMYLEPCSGGRPPLHHRGNLRGSSRFPVRTSASSDFPDKINTSHSIPAPSDISLLLFLGIVPGNIIG